MKIILVVVFLSMSIPAQAGCGAGVLDSLAQRIGHPIDKTIGRVDDSSIEVGDLLFTCKQLPDNHQFGVAAFATFNEKATNARHMEALSKFDLTVLLVRLSDQRILGKYFARAALESDVISLNGLEVDPTEYKLSEASISFGLRSRRAANSHAYIADYTTLSLFTYAHGALVKVLSNLPVDSANGDSGSCTESFSYAETKRSLRPSTTKTNGMSNLIVHTVATRITSSGNCDELEDKKTKILDSTSELIFDGKQYAGKF